MSKKRKSFRAHLAARIQKVREYKISTQSAAVAALLVLILGIGIGANSDVWNASLRTLGLKPNVPALDFSSVENTYEQLVSHYDGKVDPAKVIDGANHGLVSALGDPYTVYFNATEAKAFNSGLSGSFSGIGAALGIKDTVVTVSSVLDGSPAKAAGVKSGDKIIAVDGASTQGWSLDKAVATIRGAAGTTVKLSIARGDERPEITVTRADLTNPSVTSEVTNGVGILTISRFGDDTSSLARKAAVSFKQQNVKGIILDLRGNGGGYVDAAQNIASLWLNDKIVMTSRTGGVTVDTLKSNTSAVLNGIPTIVLIDGGSASASEIVSGALHDNKAATLYGQQSFGKGIEQNVIDLTNGDVLKVTFAHWYTPSGVNINKKGITPDTVITPTADQISAGQDPVRDAALSKLGV